MAETKEQSAERRRANELRLTVVNSIHYQQPGVDILSIDAGYTYFVKTNEQAFQRITFAREEWQPLDTGWISKASQVIIQNKYVIETRRTLTTEESEEAAKHVVMVRYKDSKDWFEIAPKESMRFKPSDLKSLEVKSGHGMTKFICTIIPE